MFDFIFWKKTFVGLDIGTSSIKVVELKLVDGRPTLSNYAWMPLGENIQGKGDINSEYFYAVLPRLLKRIFKKAKIRKDNVYVSLPAFGGLITLIDFPDMAIGDMEQAIKFEAHKYIPTSLDEVVISWDVVGKKEEAVGDVSLGDAGVKQAKNKKILQVLLVAASKEKVLKYENLVKKAGLSLSSISLEPFPMVRSLVGNDPGNFIIVDIGSEVCNIMLVEKGVIMVNRNIDAGGSDISKSIAKSMGIDDARAEQLKTSSRNFFKDNSPINFFALELVAGEVERIMKTCLRNDAKMKIDGIVLSGGVAEMTGVCEYFSDKLKVRTIAGNPFNKIKYDNSLEKIISSVKTKYSVCVGLALSGVEEYLKNKDNNK
jgi:type IV pilus assembly protein PilM